MPVRILLLALVGAMAGVLLGMVEALRMLTVAKGYFVGSAEAVTGASAAFWMAAGAGALLGWAAGLIAGRPIENATKGRGMAILAVVFLPLFWISFALITSGPQASRIPGRWAWVTLAAAAGSTGLWLFGRIFLRTLESSAVVRLVAACVLVSAASALYLADLYVLPRLYPVFHLWLFAGSLVVAALSVGLVARELFEWLRYRFEAEQGPILLRLRHQAPLLLPAVLIPVIAAGHLLWTLHTFNMRSVLAEHTVVAAKILAASAALATSEYQEPDETSPAGEKEPPAPGARSTEALPLYPGADLFLVTVDALRPDHMGLYGYQRPTTPNIDRMGRTAVVFEHAYCPIPHSSYSITSFHTGKYIHSLMDLPGVPARQETWPEMLKKVRYQTAAFFSPAVFYIDRPRFVPYLESGFGYDYRKVDPSPTAADRVSQLIEFLKGADPTRPVFGWIHFFETHEPYATRQAPRFGADDPDRYDSAAADVDDALKTLFDFIETSRPGAILIVASDHGEAFGEHRSRFHGTTLYDEQARVPLFIRAPGLASRRVQEPVSLIDLLPTALGLLGVPRPAGVQGRDVRPLLIGEASEKSSPVFSETKDLEMVVDGSLKLIRDRQGGLQRLFDLRSDPAEMQNLADARPDDARRLASRLGAWRRNMARYEIEPVRTESGASEAWPPEILAAIRGDENAASGLAGLLARPGPREPRIKAAELLLKLGGPDHARLIVQAIADPDVEVRDWASVAASVAGSPLSGDRLFEIIGRGQGVLRAKAILALAGIGDPRSVPYLCEVLEDTEADLSDRVQAAKLLGGFKDKTSVEPLIRSMAFLLLRGEAAKALASIGDLSAVKPLMTYLAEDKFPDQKAALTQALGDLKDRRAVPLLASLAAGDDPPQGILASLSELGAIGRVLPGWVSTGRCDRTLTTTLHPRENAIGAAPRLLVSIDSQSDAGRLVVSCGGQEKEVTLSAGSRDYPVDLPEACSARRGRSIDLRLSLDPQDLDACLRAAALVK